MSLKNVFAMSIAVPVFLEAMKWTRREKRSTIVVIELNPVVGVGRWDMKSIAIDPQRRSGKGIGCGVQYGLDRLSLYCWHMRHPVQYALMSDNSSREMMRDDSKFSSKKSAPRIEHHGRGTEYS